MAVEVFILTRDHNSKRSKELSCLFRNDLFVVRNLKISNLVFQKTHLSRDDHGVLKILKKSDWAKPTIIIKDDSSTLVTSKSMTRIVKDILRQSGWDLCYLSKWLDRCDLYTGSKKIAGLNANLVRTSSPHGLQAVVFSPRGKQVILGLSKMINREFFDLGGSLSDNLNKEIEKGAIIALAVTPNVFHYDVTTAREVSDLAKTSECRKPSATAVEEDESPGTGPLFWFIATIIIVILVLWSLYHLGTSGTSEVENPKSQEK